MTKQRSKQRNTRRTKKYSNTDTMQVVLLLTFNIIGVAIMAAYIYQ